MFGRRPDPTRAVTRRLRRRFLTPDEMVLAGVYAQAPGTTSAALAGGTSAGVSSAIGLHGADFSSSDSRWNEDAVRRHGVDPAVARRTVFLTVVLTEQRLLLVRRSRIIRWHPREVFAAWPLTEVERIEVPRGGSTLRILRGGAALLLELPHPLKFLAEVYRKLPERFEQARANARAGSSAESRDTDGDR